MNILATSYSLEHKSLDIYLAGCKGPHCRNCHNPESWNFDQGTPWRKRVLAILHKVALFPGMINKVMVMGGEPMDQPILELVFFLAELRRANVEVWLFTHYEQHQVPRGVKVLIDYLKTGIYDEGLITDSNIQQGIKLASSNQNISKMS